MEFNFRDVGPLEGSGGVRLGAGRLFRSGCPGNTSSEEFVRTLRVHSIRTIVDLRCPGERTESRSYYEPLADVEVLNLPFLATIREEWVNPRSQDPLSTARRYLEMIEASGGAVPELFGRLVRPEHGPFLIHCAAGRDRTGMVCALLLGSLGADRLPIAVDYGLSPSAIGDGSASRETILELFALVDAKYGNLVNLLDHLGVTSGLRSAWGALYR